MNAPMPFFSFIKGGQAKVFFILLALPNIFFAQDTITVSAAASLKAPLEAITALYHKQRPGLKVYLNFAGSGTLQQQIEFGAKVDIFISAAPEYVDKLEKKGLTLAAQVFLKNKLVAVSPKNSPIQKDVPLSDALVSPEVKRIALGEPRSVPAGRYAQEFLSNRGLLKALQPKLVYAKDVKEAYAWAASGNANISFIYFSDSLGNEKNIGIIYEVNEAQHSPIHYWAALIKGSGAQASAFYAFLRSPESARLFGQYGFTPL